MSLSLAVLNSILLIQTWTVCILAVQDMEMGVLFCTYSLLIQKSKSGKDVNLAMAKDPEGFGHRDILDQHERIAVQEASKGQLEFGVPSSQCSTQDS